MRLRNRFLLVGFGIIIFLIITPALVLYARGFQIDWETKTLIKTGALVVRTEPAKAEIFLNDEKIDSTTPANIRFVKPGDYNVRLEKEGYQSWTKRLSIKSQLVTWTSFNREYITLFKTNPTQENTVSIKAAEVSRNHQEIIYAATDQLGVVKVNDADFETILKVNNLTLPLLSTGIEIRWQNASKIINLFANQTIYNTLESQSSKIQHLETDGDRIVVTIGNELHHVHDQGTTLIEKLVSDFTLDNDGVWYIQNNNLKQYTFSGRTNTITALPTSTKNEIIRTNNQIYLILDNILYLYNEKLEKISDNVGYASWNSGQLLYANDNELYVYDPAAKDSSLIMRSLTPIQSPVLNLETGYAFYQNEGKIKAIELDGRDHRNIFTIADAQDLFVVSSDGKKLYTIGDTEIKQYTIR